MLIGASKHIFTLHGVDEQESLIKERFFTALGMILKIGAGWLNWA